MSNFLSRIGDFERTDWVAIARICSTGLFCAGILTTAVSHVGRPGITTPLTPATPPEFIEPSRAVQMLFGESTRAIDFAAPETDFVLEPIGLDGIVWRQTAEESIALLNYRGTLTRVRLGSELKDGSSVVDITPSGVVLARKGHVARLTLGLHTLNLEADPFSDVRRRFADGVPLESVPVVDTLSPTERIDALVRIHAAAALQPRALLPKRPVTPRRAGAQPFADPRFAHLRSQDDD